MKFYEKEHERFYTESMLRTKSKDCYHAALFYALGLSENTRNHINELYDFKDESIMPGALNAAWQTSSSIKVTRLAFNLFNGFDEKSNHGDYTPYELFCDSKLLFMCEAIKLRYPEYVKS